MWTSLRYATGYATWPQGMPQGMPIVIVSFPGSLYIVCKGVAFGILSSQCSPDLSLAKVLEQFCSIKKRKTEFGVCAWHQYHDQYQVYQTEGWEWLMLFLSNIYQTCIKDLSNINQTCIKDLSNMYQRFIKHQSFYEAKP